MTQYRRISSGMEKFSTTEPLENLLTVWEKLAVRERKVLLSFAFRLWAGQRLHGELSVDKKDWGYEAIEEALDASVYLACLLNDRADKAIAAMIPQAEAELMLDQTETPDAERSVRRCPELDPKEPDTFEALGAQVFGRIHWVK